ncbi:MAG: hypothetical protein WC269_01370, partial [Candidatus Gracilibacteria bacterium]
MNNNINSSYGMLSAIALANNVPAFGKFFIVIPSADTVVRDRMKELFPVDVDGKVRFYDTVAAAYAAMTSNANDVMFLSQNGNHELAEMLTVSKSRCHFV